MTDISAEEARLRSAVANNAKDFDTLFALSYFLYGQERYAEAKEHAVAAMRIHPAIKAAELLARICAALEQYAEALRFTSQIVEHIKDNPELWLFHGKVLHKCGDTGAAVRSLKKAVELKPFLVRAVRTYFHIGFHENIEDVIGVLRVLLMRDDISPSKELVIRQLLVASAEALGFQHDSKSLLFAPNLEEMCIQYAQEEHRKWLALAAALYHRKPGNADCAYHYVAATLASGTLSNLENPLLAVRTIDSISQSFVTSDEFFQDLASRKAGDILAELPPAHIVQETANFPRRAVFFGCDQKYFESFGLALLGSFLPFDSATGLHVHIFDGDESAMRDLFQKLTVQSKINLRFSIEQTGIAPDQGPAYYHIARFIRCMEYASLYPDGVWQIDADFLFHRDPAPMFDALASHDVGLWLLPSRITEPHNRIAAGAFGVSNTKAGQDYLKLVAGYLAWLWRHGRIRWGADQVALWFVLMYLRKVERTPRILAVNEEIYSECEDRSILWPGKLEKQTQGYAAMQAARERALDALPAR